MIEKQAEKNKYNDIQREVIKPLAIIIDVKISGFISPKNIYYKNFFFNFFLKVEIKESEGVGNLKIKGFD